LGGQAVNLARMAVGEYKRRAAIFGTFDEFTAWQKETLKTMCDAWGYDADGLERMGPVDLSAQSCRNYERDSITAAGYKKNRTIKCVNSN